MAQHLPTEQIGKWMGYSGMATAFLAVTHGAQGQIVYTDIEPDAVFNLPAAQLDLDGDGVIDFGFYDTSSSAGSSANHGVGVLFPIGNGVIASPGFGGPSPAVLIYGSAIGSGDPQLTTAVLNPLFLNMGHHFSSAVYGNWASPTTGYIGVRFVAGDGQDHYGWIQLDVDIEEPSYVLAYGYESTPDSAISAGATGASVGLVQAGDLHLGALIAPNPASDRTTITLPNVPANGWSINVMDPMGKVVHCRTAIRSEKFDLDLQALAPGTYFVRLDDGVNVAFRKVVKR